MIQTVPTKPSWPRAIGIGIAVSVLTAIVMVALLKAGVSPFPKPPSLAFAETLLGRPMPIGLLFHTVYVTFWSVVFVRYFPRKTLPTALGLAAVLWVVILVVFFPVVGWGLAGLAIGPQLIPASALPHLLFGLLLWGLDRYLGRHGGS